jgi:hypothetical protein
MPKKPHLPERKAPVGRRLFAGKSISINQLMTQTNVSVGFGGDL